MSATQPVPLKLHTGGSEHTPEAGVVPSTAERVPANIPEPSGPENLDSDAGSPKPSATTIAELATAAGISCFIDQAKKAYAQVPVATPAPHVECLPLASREFLSRLDQIVRADVTFPGTHTYKDLQKAAKQLELAALRSGCRQLETRVASDGESVYIDLGDEDWTMVVADRAGWKVTAQDQPRFFRPAHQRPLPPPISGGAIDELFQFTPVSRPGDRILLLAWLLSAMVPWIPSPILLLTGNQGSGKTTRSRWLRSLVDPSQIPVLGEIEMKQLIQTFSHHAVVVFENVSTFSRAVSDQFCRAVTGDGVERRKLYTDSESVLFSFRRAILINGLSVPTTRPDFLDRSIVLDFNRREKFKAQKELDDQFNAARGRLLGSMLEVLAKTLECLTSVPTDSEFRMADFARFGRAVAVALGQDPSHFDAAYRSNIRRVRHEMLEENNLARLIREVANSYTQERPWTGRVSDLLTLLNAQAKRLDLPRAESELTKSRSKLSTQLGELGSAFEAEGIVINKVKRTAGRKSWEIYQEKVAGTFDLAAIDQRLKGTTNV